MAKLPLPVIVAQGGISSAGRTSNFNAYSRLVFDALDEDARNHTLASLAQLTKVDIGASQKILDATLIRKIEDGYFSSHLVSNTSVSAQDQVRIVLSKRRIPTPIPENWSLKPIANQYVEVTLPKGETFLIQSPIKLPVSAGGMLPTGFKPELLYPSRNHPRGLAMSVYGASDAIGNLGIDLDTIYQHISPDQVAVYAGSCMGQLDDNGSGGFLQARLRGTRATSKQVPFGFAEMPADFINAYILGNLGSTGTSMGACASFLYNLGRGVDDIRLGRARLVLVGSSEAPITPEIIEGYAKMGALATDKSIRELDKISPSDTIDYRTFCRPFADNSGFTLAESAQFFVLMDASLALEVGATILGAVGDVFINADGYKKSIASPGAGNYITLAKAVAQAAKVIGTDALGAASFVQAHGTGTPQNRTSESLIFNTIAEAFGIFDWNVTAVKSYLGHSLGAAGGDQLMASLGVWKHGVVPKVQFLKQVADDVHRQHLSILTEHKEVDMTRFKVAFLNAKGFGGNNASAAIFSPEFVKDMLANQYGKKAMVDWQLKHELTQRTQFDVETKILANQFAPTYNFDHNVLVDDDIQMTTEEITLRNKKIFISHVLNPFGD